MFFNNEFFDALPAHKFRFYKGNWHEVLIDLVEKTPSGSLLASNELIRSKHYQDLKQDNKFFVKTFTTVLDRPDTNSVQKILRPEYRFQNIKVQEGDEIEVSPIGFLMSADHCKYSRCNDFTLKRCWIVCGLRRGSFIS